MNDQEKALAYAAAATGIPPFVPSRVRLHARVHGDFQFAAIFANAGEYDCESNRYGAVSVLATDGKMLGVKPAEFEVLAWRDNTGGKP